MKITIEINKPNTKKLKQKAKVGVGKVANLKQKTKAFIEDAKAEARRQDIDKTEE